MENMLPQTWRTTTKQQSRFVSLFHDRDMKNLTLQLASTSVGDTFMCCVERPSKNRLLVNNLSRVGRNIKHEGNNKCGAAPRRKKTRPNECLLLSK